VESRIADGPNSLDVDGKFNTGSTVHYRRNTKFELDHLRVFHGRGFGPVTVVLQHAFLRGLVGPRLLIQRGGDTLMRTEDCEENEAETTGDDRGALRSLHEVS
jgi:hypothetical protein